MVSIEEMLSTAFDEVQVGNVLIPAIYAETHDNPNFKGFRIDVPGWQDDIREYDGKFHPSTCSTWTVRQLYLYLTAPELLQPEVPHYTMVLAVTAGKFWHRFIQALLLRNGILDKQSLDPDGEVKIDVEYLNITGHLDGMLSTGEGLEIKTINDYQVDKIINEDILREKKPQYWAQTQDYLAAMGIASMRYLLIQPGFPFKMTEFIVNANPGHQARRANEYRKAVEIAREVPVHTEGVVFTEPCCAVKSKLSQTCFARVACPVGRMSFPT